ncbi:BatD family protein [Sulfuriferula nivalis]|uniref:DUF7939 domain-containing protein n=1 Tax=Sulfuriferula nivalis TaxID=2675298 RepID=A0A809SH63_9PROT|nr:BatD family protein [Sulfuriferula nivalis]BBP00530.1 hypothetical protein SFSGTM_12380 [Sulfuriferula nivalis]
MKTAYIIFISLLFSSMSMPVMAAINASLDQNQIAPGESVQLTLQHDGQTNSQPDLSPLKQDFEVAGQSSGSSVQIINGKVNSKVELILMLIPKHSGKLQIPALSWDGQHTPVLDLTVVAGAPGQAGNTSGAVTAHPFITTKLDQQQPYVQAAATLVIKIYVDQPLLQASLNFQPGNDVLIQQLGDDQQSSEVYKGKNYQVIQRKYLLFPQRSGQIRLDGPVLNTQVQVQDNTVSANDPFFGNSPFGGMMSATRPLRIQADPVVLNVQPRPANGSAHDWLPAQNVTLNETWKPDSGKIHAGEPVTLHLHLGAIGLTAAQLPDLSQAIQLPQGLRAYPDQAKLNNSVQSDSVFASRDQDIAIIASSAGHYQVPELHLYWWDTSKNQQKEIVLPAHTLDALPGVVTSSTGVTPLPQGASNSDTSSSASLSSPRAGSVFAGDFWKWLSLLFACMWLVTLIIWWRVRKNQSTSKAVTVKEPFIPPVLAPHAEKSRQAFQQACTENDKQAARQSLLDWARATWPQDPPVGLQALSRRLDNPVSQQLIMQLDRACYVDENWQGSALRDALEQLNNGVNKAALAETKLPGLYPK